MKRKAVFVFALIAYLLLFCTFLAPTVEREMATLAEIKHVKRISQRNTLLPMSAYEWGQVQGLFHVKEGSGWNTGARVEEIPKVYYSNPGGFYNRVELHPADYDVIMSASRTPRVGDRVEPVQLQDSPNEKLIIYCPEGYEEIVDRQDKFTVLGAGQNGILMDTSSTPMPYFEQYTVFSLENRLKADNYRVYSYTDAENLLKALPQLAVFGAIILFAAVLWAGTCVITKKQQPAWLLWGNIGLGGLSLAAVRWLGQQVDLPASLMPPESILDLAHYKSEFSNIFSAMEQVGDGSLQSLYSRNLLMAVLVLLAGGILGAVLVWVQSKLVKRKGI